jgi:hypothetical protein
MSFYTIAFAPLAIVLLVAALVIGCVFLGNALSKGQLRGPTAVAVVGAVVVLVCWVGSHQESATFQAVGGGVTVAQAPPADGGKTAVKTPPAVSNKYPSWVLDENNADWKENWKASPQQSMDEAIALITVELGDYLRNQQPPIEWTPPPWFVENLVKRSVTLNDKPLAGVPGAKKYRYEGTIQINAAVRADILRHDREFRSQQRMLWLALVVAGIVALVSVVAVYVRMDEMTKGYYTGWLRVAAVGFLGGTALVLLLLVEGKL